MSFTSKEIEDKIGNIRNLREFMIYALIFYIIRTNFLKEICAFSDRIAIRQRIHFRTQCDQKTHKFPLGNLCETYRNINFCDQKARFPVLSQIKQQAPLLVALPSIPLSFSLATILRYFHDFLKEMCPSFKISFMKSWKWKK